MNVGTDALMSWEVDGMHRLMWPIEVKPLSLNVPALESTDCGEVLRNTEAVWRRRRHRACNTNWSVCSF
jgi:hypothetical protein